jgi:predicted dienelactone hydrolase
MATAILMLVGARVLSSDAQDRPPYDQPGPHKVKTLEFPGLKDRSREDRSVPLKVLFPSEGRGFPLVVISHGGGGNWDANLYQAQHLASHGYVVVNVEHVYSNNTRVKYYMSRRGGGMRFLEALHRITTDPKAVLERPRDVSFAIDQAALWNREHEEIARKIDTRKIAAMGHSFGAYTTLVVCGARPILDHLEPSVQPGKGLAGDLSDSRVTFGFAMSPQSPGTTYFGKESYKTINRPLVCLTGSKDVQKSSTGRMMLPGARALVLDLLPKGDKLFLWLENADHFGFSDGPKAHVLPSKARKDAQRISKALMVVACDHYLKGKKEASANMNADFANSLCGDVITKIGWHAR